VVRVRRALAGWVLLLAVACSTAPAPRAEPGDAGATTVAAPASTAPTTTTVPVPPDVQDLIATTTMTDRARRIFVAANPAIEDTATFLANCGLALPTDTTATGHIHTQGCYAAGRIHLLAPERAEARELLTVVAAHELLHAVYASLAPPERARIDAELEAARVGNDRLEDRLKVYGEGPTLINEIHSILGSEFDGLSPALEAHYAQFFTNRAAIVAARQRTLGSREDEIRRMQADVDALDARILDLRATQEQLRAVGNLRTYNANVPVINGLIDQYNQQVDVLNARIDEYNSLLGA